MSDELEAATKVPEQDKKLRDEIKDLKEKLAARNTGLKALRTNLTFAQYKEDSIELALIDSALKAEGSEYGEELKARIAELEAGRKCEFCGDNYLVCGKAWEKERAKLLEDLAASNARYENEHENFLKIHRDNMELAAYRSITK